MGRRGTRQKTSPRPVCVVLENMHSFKKSLGCGGPRARGCNSCDRQHHSCIHSFKGSLIWRGGSGWGRRLRAKCAAGCRHRRRAGRGGKDKLHVQSTSTTTCQHSLPVTVLHTWCHITIVTASCGNGYHCLSVRQCWPACLPQAQLLCSSSHMLCAETWLGSPQTGTLSGGL